MPHYIDGVVMKSHRRLVDGVFSADDLAHVDETYRRLRDLTTKQDVLRDLADTYNASVVESASTTLISFYLYNYLHVLCNTPRSSSPDSVAPKDTDFYRDCDEKLFAVANEREYTFQLKCRSDANRSLYDYYKGKLVDFRSRMVYKMAHVDVYKAVSFYPRLFRVYEPPDEISVTDVRVRKTRTLSNDKIEYDAKVILARETVRRGKDISETVKLSVEVPFTPVVESSKPPVGELFAPERLSAGRPDTVKATSYRYLNRDRTVRLSVDHVSKQARSVAQRRRAASNYLCLEFEDAEVSLVDVYKWIGKALHRAA